MTEDKYSTEVTYIQSYSGTTVDFLNPKENQILLEDIAHALSLLCRFGGHCSEFYSVADHSIRCSEKAPDGFKFEALMHDATEAFLVDVPRPIKQVLPGYRDIEAGLDVVIRKKFGLPEKMSKEVHHVDGAMLSTEKRDLMKPSDRPWSSLPDPYEEKIVPRTPEQSYKDFIDRFNELTKS